MQRLVDTVLWPLVGLLGVVGAVIRTLYWGLMVTPSVFVVSLLVSVGSTPKPVVPLLRALGGRDLHRMLGEILWSE